MNFYRLISTLFHPIVIPTIGTLLYFMLIPINFMTKQKVSIIAIIFVCTYIIPLLIIILFKKLKVISSLEAPTSKERKLPILSMIILYYSLASFFYNVPNIRELGILFYAATCTLVIAFIVNSFNFKISLHLLSIGLMLGFFIMMNKVYPHQFLVIIFICLLIGGLVANARLELNFHQPKEVYAGFFLGLITTITTYMYLQ